MNSSTFGPAYDSVLDGERIRRQMQTIKEYMLQEEWKTLQEMENMLHYPQASISAELRHLRKVRFGGYAVDKRRRQCAVGKVWEYRVRVPSESAQLEMAGVL